MMAMNCLRLMLFVALALAGGAHPAASGQQGGQTLHERAKKAGGKLLWHYKPDRRLTHTNLRQLVQASDVVVIGRPLVLRARLRPDGKAIMQDAVVKAQSVVKGGVRPGETLKARLPGGVYRFPDGTYAHTIPQGYTPAEVGKLYAFFFKWKDDGYELTTEMQGLFALKEEGVEPADTVGTDPLVARLRGMSPPSFIGELRRAAGGRKP